MVPEEELAPLAFITLLFQWLVREAKYDGGNEAR